MTKFRYVHKIIELIGNVTILYAQNTLGISTHELP